MITPLLNQAYFITSVILKTLELVNGKRTKSSALEKCFTESNARVEKYLAGKIK